MRKLNKTIATATMLITALFAAPTDVGAQMAWQENFDYPAGNLYGQGSWGKYASNPNEPIQVIDRALDYAGYPGGVKGKSVRLGPATNGEDLAARFDPSEEGIKSGTVYYSALINVEQPSTGPVYVMTLVARNFSSPVADGKSGTELGKLYVDAGNAEGEYRLGVERGGTNAAYAERTFSTGETYLVVVKYEIGVGGERQDAVSLFVNPASYTEEPALADAYFDPMGSGSGVGSWGLQGIELRQGTTYSATAPTMLVGSLRVADSYAGLFAEQQGPDEDAPAITLSERSLDFGGIYGGDVQTKTVNVKAANLKGDITVSVTGDELKPSVTTIAAADAQSADGVDVTFTLTPVSEEGRATVTFGSDGAADAVIEATWATVPVKNIATLKEFAAENGDDDLTYRYTGEAVVAFVDNSSGSPVYYLQDATGGQIVRNDHEMLATTYKEGDRLTGFIGMIASSFGVNTFIPLTAELGTLVSENNTVEPTTATLGELKAAPADYINRLVRIENATLSDFDEGAVFAAGMSQPTITDATGEGRLRIFGGTTLIGTAIPTEAVNITGLSTSTGAVIIAPRGATDITPAVVAEPSLTVTPDKLDMTAGLVGKPSVVGTLHISAVNMPAETILEITGTDRALFSLSATTIPAGTSETDITITYLPTAIGKHSARLLIDCPQMPAVSQAIALSAYATDEQNPPSVTVSPEQVPAFSAVVGQTSEQTITVTTAYLPDYAYMRVKEAGAFRISTTMLMKDNTAQVKVTFAPNEAGEYDNEIQIYGLALDTVRVKISGTATESTGPDPGKEGDSLPLDDSQPVKLLNETFDSSVKNEPLSIEGWKNLAMEGNRAWWGYVFPDEDESAGEHTAKVTAYDSSTPDGEETACEMMLVTPALDFNGSESKIFTFRVRGDYLMDNQTDVLELCYIDMTDGEMYVAPVEGFTMPNMQDLSGEWQEYHIDLTGQNIADAFFMGFRFKSTRGRDNAATYYIDDVSYGRTDLATIRTSLTQLAFTATQGKDAVSDEVTVSGTNLAEPIKLSLGGPNKSKFKLSVTELPVTGGTFTVAFNSDDIGVHEAYVKLASRGAADIYVPVSVNNTVLDCIEGIDAEPGDITVFDLNGRKICERKQSTAAQATESLPAGIYVIQKTTANGITINKVKID